jgi:queuine tRNA-ribosyltransferase
MNWPHPILTDSGGFQVMSLSQLRKIDEQAVTFRSHLDGAMVDALAGTRGRDPDLASAPIIIMQLDECVRLPAARADIERAMQLSLRWAERCKRAFEAAPADARCSGSCRAGTMRLCGVASARALADMDFQGYSIGGLAVGEPQAVMLAMIETVMPHLPAGRPHYLMGVGTPEDLLEAVARGVDMFDCVMPTRNGRPRPCLYALWSGQPEECAPRRRSASARCGQRLSGGADLFARLPSSSREGERDARGDACCRRSISPYYQALMRGMRDAIEAKRFTDFLPRDERELGARRSRAVTS